jgi:diguanylate cyclase (GGDEF)-like protein
VPFRTVAADRVVRMLATAYSRLRGYRATFFVVALFSCALIVVVAGELSTKIGDQAARLSVTVREREGLAYTTLIVKSVRSLRQLRDRVLFDGGDDRAQRQDVSNALSSLSSYENVSGRPFELAKRVEALEGEWSAVPPGASGATAVADVLDTATKLSGIASDRSSLVADPDGATAALVDAYGTQLPIVEQRIDDAKLVLYRAQLQGGVSERDRVAAATLIGEARQAYLSADEEFENATRTVGALPTIGEQLTSIGGSLDAFSSILDRTRAPGVGRGPAESLRAVADSVIDSVDIAYEGLGATIDANLKAREAYEKGVMASLLGGVATAVLFGVGILVWLGVTMQRRYLRTQARNRRELERLEGELTRQRLLDALEVTEAHFRAAFDRSSIGVAILDRDGTVLRTNARIHQLVDPVEPGAVGAGAVDYRRLFAGEIESFTTELYREEADAWFEATVSLVRDDDHEPRFAISMLKDVTERKKIADRFRHEAMHDALSGLPNRACFQEHVQSALDTAPKGVRAVLYIDVDEFKLVNDSFGHAVGDRVIVWCAEQLRTSVHPGDFVARFGGDEFAAFVSGPDVAHVEDTVRRLSDALSETLVLDGRDIFIAVSIGIAYVDESHDSVDAIVRDADTAMYAAKANGSARYAVFDRSMREDVSRRISLSLQLRRALEREQFYLVYQPVVSLSTGVIDSFEVLLRWEHPELGSISPVEFIPLAEELGLIVPIGRFVLDRACAQFAEWKRDFPEQRPRRISVNCSVREIVQGDFVENVAVTLQRHGVAPQELVLEVTESTVLASGRTSGAPLERLRDIGVGLAIDDFGTGFSSLRYLQQFPFDTLKIDRSFVGGEDGGLASEAIVTMLLSLAEAVGVSVTAEGVETAAQAKRLRELGCAEVQGYFFGRPTRASDVPSVFYQIAAVAS